MKDNYYYKNRKKIGAMGFFRDILIARFPSIFSSVFLRRFLQAPDFIFLTHPRNWDDINATFPFVLGLSKILPRSWIVKILRMSPCYVIAKVTAPHGKVGYFITVTDMPDAMFHCRQLALSRIRGVVDFFKKITRGNVYVGLAAWWPIISNSGLAFQKHLEECSRIKITTGHTATLMSLYLSILKISNVISVPLGKLKLCIVGVGKVGGAVAELFFNKVARMGLVDQNLLRIETIQKNLQKKGNCCSCELIKVDQNNSEKELISKISQYDLVVCTTSNTGLLVNDSNLIKNCLIIDDSRPEAFPRVIDFERHAVVLEGGLVKVPGTVVDSDFGCGVQDDIFGCLAEAIILALDGERNLVPNVGDIDYDNFYKMIEFSKSNSIGPGDFKCAHRNITDYEVRKLYEKHCGLINA